MNELNKFRISVVKPCDLAGNTFLICFCSLCRKNTPLHYAVLNSHVRIIKYLVRHGADVHAGDRGGNTPMHLACKEGNEQVITLLIKCCRDDLLVDVNNCNQAPLDLAISTKHPR